MALVESGTMTDSYSQTSNMKISGRNTRAFFRYSASVPSVENSTLEHVHNSSTIVVPKVDNRCTRSPERAREKPFINFIPLPYSMDGPVKPNLITKLSLPKLQVMRSQKTAKELPTIEMEIDEVPINEYLDYCLSQDINVEMRDAKVLAQELKRIKEEKRRKVKQPKTTTEETKKPVRKKRMPLGVLRSNLTFG